MTKGAIENAIRAMAAIGGSTNTVLHLLAIAREAGVPLTIDDCAELWRGTPQVARVNPAGPATVPDFHRAGGLPAVLREIEPLLDFDALTVTGQTMAGNLHAPGASGSGPTTHGGETRSVPAADRSIIRPASDPWLAGGGLAVLRGNLAPAGAITRPAAFPPHLQVFTGHARCFDTEQAANEAILGGRIVAGTAILIRFMGPRGGPGMPEMYAPMMYLAACGLAASCAVISDGRFSGTNNGCFVGHVSPEAAVGGPVALVHDGDGITIDVDAGAIRLNVDDAELARRRALWKPPQPYAGGGLLGLYARLAGPAERGAVLELDSMQMTPDS